MITRALLLRYISFAIVATGANLATQRVVLGSTPEEYGIMPAMFAGTLIGLGIKFILDKYWIFYDQRGGAVHYTKQFSLYTLMGVATTAIFWATEYLFWVLFQTDMMREFGAVIGLSIGYFSKYHLDKHFVFRPSQEKMSAL